MFNNAVNILGSNPILNHTSRGDNNVTVYQSSGPKGFESLTKHVATGALHNSGEVSDAPKCHPGTRVAILDTVFQWAMASVYLVCIQWIHGPAGAGKSAILRTLAEMLEKHGQLLASFFFFRSAAGRNNTDHFIPTIAYQIALRIPSTRRLIEQAIETDPLIFSKSLEAQAQALIILPLTEAHKEGDIGEKYPRIIIVDGLDECLGEEKQRTLLQVLNDMLPKLPLPFAILIASRPEPHIRYIFNSSLNKTSTRLELDDSHQPDGDIQKFYDDKFLEIREHHPLRSCLPKPWPPHPVIMTLIGKASGQFIFPATVIKFVEPHRHNPLQRLGMVMGSISPGKLRPFEALDNLYSTIFASIDPDDLNGVLAVLGVLLVPYSGIDIREIDNLAHLVGYDKTGIKQLLFDLESLLQIQVQKGCTLIRIHHASLADFLFDQHRSGQFFVSPPIVYAQLARRFIETLLFSEDSIVMRILEQELGHVLNNAEPTKELIETLKDCNTAGLTQKLKRKTNLIWTLNIVFTMVLPAISSSALPDFLHAHLLATLREVISLKVDYYFDANLTPLLVYLMDMLNPSDQAFPNRSHSNSHNPSNSLYYTCYTRIHPIHRLDGCPIEEANQDQQNGFCLTLLSYSEFYESVPRDPRFYTLLINVMGNRAGDCYAGFAIRALNWMSKFPIIPALLDGVVPNDIQEIGFFLPYLLQKSPPRLDVQQAVGDNPFHSIMLEKIPEYAAGIWEYFLRANADPSQEPAADSSSCSSDCGMV